ncbi:hypothetical protein CFP56_028986 [Quercus suber]|uniref:DC1 domain-containing protein n=1 Tax=Quercus suber TaxID=58331 RepID=A0AAW0JU24_QUESU
MLFWCDACGQLCNGFTYKCNKCDFDLDVQCSLILDILTHKGHEHFLRLSSTRYSQKCDSCNFESSQGFRCTTCEFVLDFKCATLPLIARYKQHEHPFILSYAAEDDSGEYYCDICEEERDPKQWFYYCAYCSYPAHSECILGKYPNFKFGVSYTFDYHPHPLTMIHKTKDHHACHKCDGPCDEGFFYQCVSCNFNVHTYKPNCTSCDFESFQVFCCITCEFHYTLNMLNYHILQGRNNTSTPSLLVMLLNMIPTNIIVIFVKNKTQCIDSTTMQIMENQHVCNNEHSLVFNEDERRGILCWACREPVLGPSYNCIKCKKFHHHKSCAELPRELQHPLHPKHSLILFAEWKRVCDKEYSKCEVCKEFLEEYTYGCSHCNFNLHSKCATLPLTIETEVHDHPLTRMWKSIKFTCDLCGKEGNVPFLCAPCNFCIHPSCASYVRNVKVIRHDHILRLTISSFKVNQSVSRFCRLCVQKVDTDYGFYYCSSCDFVAHLDCATDKENREDINLLKLTDESKNDDLELDGFINSKTYIVKKINVSEDGIEIAIEIEHFSHEHDLKLTNEVENNKKCDVVPSVTSFFINLVLNYLEKNDIHFIDTHFIDTHSTFSQRHLIGVSYLGVMLVAKIAMASPTIVRNATFILILMLDILIHKGHEHHLYLSNTRYEQNCSSCDFESFQVYRYITCEFALDFKRATLPLTARYKQHEHPFTLSYAVEDDSGEYYCDICEKERDPKH